DHLSQAGAVKQQAEGTANVPEYAHDFVVLLVLFGRELFLLRKQWDTSHVLPPSTSTREMIIHGVYVRELCQIVVVPTCFGKATVHFATPAQAWPHWFSTNVEALCQKGSVTTSP